VLRVLKLLLNLGGVLKINNKYKVVFKFYGGWMFGKIKREDLKNVAVREKPRIFVREKKIRNIKNVRKNFADIFCGIRKIFFSLLWNDTPNKI